jgi:hypothetical protein
MRFIVLKQMAVHRSPQRIDTLPELIEHDERVLKGPERRKLARTLNELYDYLESNRDLIPDYGDRRRHGEAISSSIAESTVNQVISREGIDQWRHYETWLASLRAALGDAVTSYRD